MERLDQALARRGLLPTRAKAKAAILEGAALVNGLEERRPSRMVTEADALSLRDSPTLRYASRGGAKLRKALDLFEIPVLGLRCLDIGASTGGFTQVLLERGASLVYAVDVGTAQLAQPLREDPRVLNLERTDFRRLSSAQIAPVAFACADVSFISLKHILPRLPAFLQEGSHALCLLKPQFEVGPQRVRKGIVKEPRAHVTAIREVAEAARQAGLRVCGLTHSPIRGGAGNIEYLLHIFNGTRNQEMPQMPRAEDVVRLAWEELR
jgi:23S rRNA (cytidine1920-2'-O)/16S rRNA (cytidine1409-2'-O)-methyltransferase